MKLGERIAVCRKKMGWSQEALAEKLSVSRQTVSRWETGEALPDVEKVVLLAGLFGVTVGLLALLLHLAGLSSLGEAYLAPFSAVRAGGAFVRRRYGRRGREGSA